MIPNDLSTSQKYYLKKKYGLTPEEFCEMYEEQDERCAICKTNKWWPYVDHDLMMAGRKRGNGQVRGLLCNRCNRSIGAFEENHEYLRAASDYLIRTRSGFHESRYGRITSVVDAIRE